MKLPYDREAMTARNRLDARLAAERASGLTPSARLAEALELCDTVRALARAAGASWVTDPPDDLADKARRYPVRLP